MENRIGKQVGRNKYMLFVYLIALVPRVILSLYAIPMRVTSDELSTLAVAAHFAGYNWTESTSIAGYYGTGFSVLYTPLFLLIDDPVLLYRSLVFVQSMLISAVAPIAYYIMNKYFKIREKIYLLCRICSKFVFDGSYKCIYL